MSEDGIIIIIGIILLIGIWIAPVWIWANTYDYTQEFGKAICDYNYGSNTTTYVRYDSWNKIIQCEPLPQLSADKFDGIYTDLVHKVGQ